jgi:DNA polymerase alpha subunit B
VYPDPSIFEASGITFGVTSTDILKHLANNEISKSTITDRMSGLSKLILSQKSLYPLYPPDESVPLDVQLCRKHCKFANKPHVLIMPSDLRYFIKDIDGTIVVNPERLTKGKSGGTYARLQIKLPEQVGGESTSSSVADFCCGEIIKI